MSKNTTTGTGWFVDHFMCKKRLKSSLIGELLNPSRGFKCAEMSRDSTDVRTAPPCGLFASCICSLAEGHNVALQESFHTIRQMKICHSYSMTTFKIYCHVPLTKHYFIKHCKHIVNYVLNVSCLNDKKSTLNKNELLIFSCLKMCPKGGMGGVVNGW